MVRRSNRGILRTRRLRMAKWANNRMIYNPLRAPINRPTKFKLTQRLQGYFGTGAGVSINQQVFVNDPNNCTDFASLQQLYDLYKITGCKVKFYPKFIDSSVPGAAGTAFSPIYVFYDPDSSVAVTTVDAAVQYDNHKVFNLYRPWKYYCSPIVQSDTSVNAAGALLAFRKRVGAMFDIINPTYYHKGIIGWVADTLTTGTQYGDIVVTYYCLCSERR